MTMTYILIIHLIMAGDPKKLAHIISAEDTAFRLLGTLEMAMKRIS